VKKLLVTLLAAVAFAAPAQAGNFGETNVEKGCILLSLTVSTRVDDTPWLQPAGCARLKATFTKPKASDNWIDCTLGLLMARNRARGIPDFDRPSKETRVNVLKGCVMMISDYSERDADYITGAIKD
jgi:hypothetical protein